MQPHPMPAFGSFCLLLGLSLTIYSFAIGALALWGPVRIWYFGWINVSQQMWNRVSETARRAGIASFVAITCAAFALVWAAFTNDFSVEYIRQHSNLALNPAYKFAALWSGQEGSLLLWAWLLAGYGLVLRVRHRVDVRLTAFASVILAGIQIFFLLLLCLGAPPFSITPGPVPADGNGLKGEDRRSIGLRHDPDLVGGRPRHYRRPRGACASPKRRGATIAASRKARQETPGEPRATASLQSDSFADPPAPVRRSAANGFSSSCGSGGGSKVTPGFRG